MRVRLGRLKRLIDEAVGDERYMDEEQARMFVMDMDGDDIADADLIDEETGEVYLRQGQSYHESPWSPDHKVDPHRAEADEVYAQRAGVWDDYHENDEDDQVGLDDLISSWKDDEYAEEDRLRKEFHDAVKEWAEGWGDAWLDMKHGQYPEGDGPPAPDVAYDAADSFFFQHHDRWRNWARVLGMSAQNMKEILADYAYDAMVKADPDA